MREWTREQVGFWVYYGKQWESELMWRCAADCSRDGFRPPERHSGRLQCVVFMGSSICLQLHISKASNNSASCSFIVHVSYPYRGLVLCCISLSLQFFYFVLCSVLCLLEILLTCVCFLLVLVLDIHCVSKNRTPNKYCRKFIKICRILKIFCRHTFCSIAHRLPVKIEMLWEPSVWFHGNSIIADDNNKM